MGRIAEFFEQRAGGYSLADLDRDMDSMVWGRGTATGVVVSEQNALNYTPYFAGVRLISETVGQVPLIYYKRVTRGTTGRSGKERASTDDLYWMLHNEPNPEMDAISFKSALTGQCVTWGNAYAEIEWDMRRGEVTALWPLDVSRMRSITRDPNTQEQVFNYLAPDGITYGLPAWRVWTLTGFGYNGLVGYNNVALNRESLGLGKALEENAARFFGNGSRPGGILQHPGHLSKEAKDKNIEHWQSAYGGLSNSNRLAILDEGITYKEIGIPPATAQQLESRTFQVQEVSRMLNVTPHKLMEMSHATYSNIEHQDLEFMKYTMGIWFRRWEQTCDRKLLLPSMRRTTFFEFLEDALLRADSVARSTFYKELSYLGAMSPNDIREKENMNPIDDPAADRYYVQRNMIPIDLVDEVLKAESARSIDLHKTTRSEGVAELRRQVAAREKANLLKAAAREGENFSAWLDGFYRDFTNYVIKEAVPAMGSSAAAFAGDYVRTSQSLLSGINADGIAGEMEDWEERRAGSE